MTKLLEFLLKNEYESQFTDDYTDTRADIPEKQRQHGNNE
jgi:hypothetical protein